MKVIAVISCQLRLWKLFQRSFAQRFHMRRKQLANLVEILTFSNDGILNHLVHQTNYFIPFYDRGERGETGTMPTKSMISVMISLGLNLMEKESNDIVCEADKCCKSMQSVCKHRYTFPSTIWDMKYMIATTCREGITPVWTISRVYQKCETKY